MLLSRRESASLNSVMTEANLVIVCLFVLLLSVSVLFFLQFNGHRIILFKLSNNNGKLTHLSQYRICTFRGSLVFIFLIVFFS